MNTININFKVCKLCNKALPLENFRPKRRMCKTCVYIREKEAHKELSKQYYLNHKDKLLIRQVIYYHKKNEGKQLRITKPRKHNISDIVGAVAGA